MKTCLIPLIPLIAVANVLGSGAWAGQRSVKSGPSMARAADCSDDHVLCLRDDRFQITVEWQNFELEVGEGRAALERREDSGLFWFFNENNWELLIKVLDGCPINDHFWLFSAATTNVGYSVTVRDLEGGLVRRFENQLGVRAPAVTDTLAFPTCEGPPVFATCSTPDSANAENLSWSIDANHDDLQDLLVLSGRVGAPAVRVMSQRSTLEFETTFEMLLPGAGVTEAAVGDFDGNGFDDFVVALTGTAPGLAFFENLGTGAFQTHFLGPTLTGPLELIARDLDDDERLDLVVPDFDVGYSMLLNRGHFTFFEVRVQNVCEYLTFGDFDGDGLVDGVCADVNEIAIFDDIAGAASDGPNMNLAGGEARNVRSRDLDGDGRDEILLAVYTGGSSGDLEGRLDVLAWEGSDLVTKWSSESFEGFPYGVQVCDIDGDDVLDLAFACGGVHALLAVDDGFSFGSTLTGSGFNDRFVCEDLDRDGRVDLVSGCRCELEVLCR